MTGGHLPCPDTHGVGDCNAAPPGLVDALQVPRPTDDLRHIAIVIPEPGAEKKAEPAAAPEPTPPQQPVPDSVPEPPKATPATAPDGDWVVQVGAFEDRATAQKVVRRLDRDGTVIVPTRQDGKDWNVVLLGSYPSREAADDAGRAYAADTGGSYWVRGATGVEAVRRSEDE